jgi:hypothetical protein
LALDSQANDWPLIKSFWILNKCIPPTQSIKGLTVRM